MAAIVRTAFPLRIDHAQDRAGRVPGHEIEMRRLQASLGRAAAGYKQHVIHPIGGKIAARHNGQMDHPTRGPNRDLIAAFHVDNQRRFEFRERDTVLVRGNDVTNE